LLVLKEQGAERFFGEPAVNIQDFMQRDFSGNGVISLLSADRLTREAPHLYATFLIWLLSELFEELPEAGDLEQPKLVLFFDEAHLLFKGMPKALLEKIEQVVRLIRSKAVGIYFITQSPLDIPESILGQLGLKVQHALRAYTPKDQRAIKAISQGFRSDGTINVKDVITQLAQGEALVSCLNERGAPTIVATTLIRPPESRIGAATAQERNSLRERSPMNGRYEKKLDRHSAYEMLEERAARALEEAERERLQAEREKEAAKARKKATTQRKPRRSNRQSIGEAMMKSAARSIGRSLGTKFMRGILGSLLK
jgi:DNA helicase HerA-like ATPase